MPVLICQPVSRRSAPEKIERWISHLVELREQHEHDSDAVETIDRLLSKAARWVGQDDAQRISA